MFKHLFFTYTPNNSIYSIVFVRWATESSCPFQIINNPSFHMLMKTGRPDCYIPLTKTLSYNVKNIFVYVCRHISKMLKVISVCIFHSKGWIDLPYTIYQNFNGKLNFATDAWSSPNYKAYIAFTVHFENHGKPMLMLLNIIEVAQSHTGVILGDTFVEVLKAFSIERKARHSSIQTK